MLKPYISNPKQRIVNWNSQLERNVYFRNINKQEKNTRSFFFPINHTIGELGFLLVDQSEMIVFGAEGAPIKCSVHEKKTRERSRPSWDERILSKYLIKKKKKKNSKFLNTTSPLTNTQSSTRWNILCPNSTKQRCNSMLYIIVAHMCFNK